MQFMSAVAEEYSAVASERGHLQRVIQASSHFTVNSGLDLYDVFFSIGFNTGLHCVVDEIRPFAPVDVVAGALHTKEKTPRRYVRKSHVFQQVFYFAIAKHFLA